MAERQAPSSGVPSREAQSSWRPSAEHLLGEWPGSFQEGTQPANYVAVEARAIAAFLHEAATHVSNDDRRLTEAIVRKLTRPDPRSTETPRLVRLLNALIDLKRSAISFAGFDDVLAATRSAIALVAEVECRWREPPHKSAQPDQDGVFRPRRQTGLYHLSAEQLGSQMQSAAVVLARFADEADPQATSADKCTGGGPSVREECAHSDDFSSVRWFGTVYDFTPNQAKCVAVLWDHWNRGGLAVSSQRIRDTAEVEAERLDVVFRGHPAWGTMIVAAAKGSYRLAEPSVSIPAKSARAKSTGK